MNKRSTKFYRKNEAEVMKRLGMKPTKNSGAGWVEKCDGQNEQFICELKSTDKDSFSLKQQMLNTLEYHASIAHKTPIFALQFLNRDEIWVAITEDEFKQYMKFKKQRELEKYLSPLLEQNDKEIDFDIDTGEQKEYNTNVGDKENINNSYYARLSYKKQKQKEFEKETEKRKNKMKERRYNTDWRKK